MIQMQIDTGNKKSKIDKNIYGHFVEHLGRCIYEGIWVGKDSSISNTNGIRNDVINALKEIKIPVLRWPGGCFADEYHWKDGVGPIENRTQMVNVHWGGEVENNHFGTHEFMLLCELLNTEPYICGNIGSGTVQEMRDWIEYLTFDGQSSMANWRQKNGKKEAWKIKYFGVGNENWCCGGNMRPEYYADLYRQYSTYIRDFSGNKIFKIACGACGDDYNWTEILMKEAGKFMDGLSLHHYIVPGPKWEQKGSATDFSEVEWFETMKKTFYMDELISKHSKIMDKYDPKKRVSLIFDEWGIWHDAESGTNPGFLYQQNTLRDALVAAIILNIFNNHCDRIKMANIAQTVNVLQALILTKKEKMILTPTYHVFNMYKVHHDTDLLEVNFKNLEYNYNDKKIPQINISASIDSQNKIHITLCNLNHLDKTKIKCELNGSIRKNVKASILTNKKMNAHNTFENPEEVKPVLFQEVSIEENNLSIEIPPMSIIALEVS